VAKQSEFPLNTTGYYKTLIYNAVLEVNPAGSGRKGNEAVSGLLWSFESDQEYTSDTAVCRKSGAITRRQFGFPQKEASERIHGCSGIMISTVLTYWRYVALVVVL